MLFPMDNVAHVEIEDMIAHVRSRAKSPFDVRRVARLDVVETRRGLKCAFSRAWGISS